jgi:hypothetical protein
MAVWRMAPENSSRIKRAGPLYSIRYNIRRRRFQLFISIPASWYEGGARRSRRRVPKGELQLGGSREGGRGYSRPIVGAKSGAFASCVLH